jgi:hypothetical protein
MVIYDLNRITHHAEASAGESCVVQEGRLVGLYNMKVKVVEVITIFWPL